MPAEDVVDASLKGLEKGKLFVVPGWRYKLLVGLIRLMPRSVLHYALTRGPASLRRERKPSKISCQSSVISNPSRRARVGKSKLRPSPVWSGVY